MIKCVKILILAVSILSLDIFNLNAQDNDSSRIDSLYIQAATYYQQKDYEKTREYALKILDINPNYGDAYILIGVAYAASAEKCSDSNFSKGMIYCLAVDMFEKAKRVDSSQTERADERIKVFSKYFPSRESIPFGIYEGAKYIIECWINKETTVRFSDY